MKTLAAGFLRGAIAGGVEVGDTYELGHHDEKSCGVSREARTACCLQTRCQRDAGQNTEMPAVHRRSSRLPRKRLPTPTAASSKTAVRARWTKGGTSSSSKPS